MWIDKKNVLTILAAILIIAVIGTVCKILTPGKTEKKNLPVLKAEKTIKITVRKGYCLSEIAQDLGSNWQEIAEINNLKNPDLIYPKQKLMVPVFSQTNIVKVSWYFHNGTMANGRLFNMNDKTVVAHRWLPFGTKIRLTRTDNKKSIEVTVQDRGPYIEERHFDLSRGAAEMLDMIDKGVTTCRIEILN